MSYDRDEVASLKGTYSMIRGDIEKTLSGFRRIWDSDDEVGALHELLFCILTPQSKAQVCWGAVEDMACRDILLKGNYEEVLDAVSNVRFKYKKAGYLIEARERFSEGGRIHLLDFIRDFEDVQSARDWIVRNIKGLGHKEASHFLRNIGLGDELTILDRHILRALIRAKVISGMPSSLGGRKYLEIEEKMKEFSEKIDIPVSHLDIVIWYRSTGSIFK